MDKLNVKKIKDALRELIDQCGIDVLSDYDRFKAAIKDIMTDSQLKNERQLLVFSIKIGVGKELLKAVKAETKAKREAMGVATHLLDMYGFEKEYREDILKAYTLALGWDDESISNENKATQVSQTSIKRDPASQENTNKQKRIERMKYKSIEIDLPKSNQSSKKTNSSKSRSSKKGSLPPTNKQSVKGPPLPDLEEASTSYISKQKRSPFALFAKLIPLIVIVLCAVIFVFQRANASIVGSWVEKTPSQYYMTARVSEDNGVIAYVNYSDGESDLPSTLFLNLKMKQDPKNDKLYTLDKTMGSISYLYEKEPYLRYLAENFKVDIPISSSTSYNEVVNQIVAKIEKEYESIPEDIEKFKGLFDLYSEDNKHVILRITLDELFHPEKMPPALREDWFEPKTLEELQQSIDSIDLELVNHRTINFWSTTMVREKDKPLED